MTHEEFLQAIPPILHQVSATNRKLAAQSIRAVTKMKTVSAEEVRLLLDNPEDVPTIERVLASYEARQVWQAGHGDVPLKLRRAIKLLTPKGAA